ncbi:MAG: TlpA disulfide reductase family protein [Planctomycetaceae bacterium]
MRRLSECVALLMLVLAFGCTGSDSGSAGNATGPGTETTSNEGPESLDPGPVPPGQYEPTNNGDLHAAGGERPMVGGSTPGGVPGPAPLAIQSWDEFFAGLGDHKGKVVVVDIWSTSCPPCIAEFPELVKLHQELGADVVCLSLSVDYEGIRSKPVESYLESVQQFLNSKGANFPNTLCSDDFDTLADQRKLSSIPVVMVYDQQGKLVRKFDGPTDEGEEFTYANNIRPLVESLLKPKS